jgi:methylmalonyl-CoA/ethylmalonyl-CoA epimerase
MLSDFMFHHIGIATPSIEHTSKLYIDSGYAMTTIIIDPYQKVRISFLSKENMPMLELLEPVDETSPVFKTIAKSGVTPYHFCYEVKNITDAVSRLKSMRYVALMTPVNAVALENRRICFLFHKDVGLIELVEK